jgi:hypothetical protein
MSERKMALVALFNSDYRWKIYHDVLPLVTPFTWYPGPHGVPVTVIETPEGECLISMNDLIDANTTELELGPEDFGFPPGTPLRPPVP